jgi:S1-C subfamily serine protease
MRPAILLAALAAASVLSLAPPARADEPKGRIGVQLKVDGGKIVVVEPIADSPAEKAGVKAGDVIRKVNEYKVKDDAETDDLTELVQEVGKHEPGEKIKLTVERDGKEMVIEVTVGKLP